MSAEREGTDTGGERLGESREECRERAGEGDRRQVDRGSTHRLGLRLHAPQAHNKETTHTLPAATYWHFLAILYCVLYVSFQ